MSDETKEPTAVVTTNWSPPAQMTRYDAPMTPEELLEHVQLVQKVMSMVMEEGEHYGVIPGCNKPSIYKSGAEKLGATFHLDPKFYITRTDLPNGHREYEAKCVLHHHASGRTWEGVGVCSTMEARYRYRGAEKEFTDKPVPREYWDLPKEQRGTPNGQAMLGGKGFSVGKNDDGQWFICKKGAKMENPDIADVYNTCLKMSQIRAHRGVILTATAASDIFTQDVEDLPAEMLGKPVEAPPAQSPPSREARVPVPNLPDPLDPPEFSSPRPAPSSKVEKGMGYGSEKQIKRIYGIASSRAKVLKMKGMNATAIVEDVLKQGNLQSTDDIPDKATYDVVCEACEHWSPPNARPDIQTDAEKFEDAGLTKDGDVPF